VCLAGRIVGKAELCRENILQKSITKMYYKNNREVILKLYRMRLKDVIENRYRTFKTKRYSVSFEVGHVRHEV
jgi:hypothetical protein